MEIFYVMILVVVIQLYTFIKTHQTVHLKRINLTICKLYNNNLTSSHLQKYLPCNIIFNILYKSNHTSKI